jgi:hypothetical protein
LLSDLAVKLDVYKTYSAINAIIIFWRTLQFFSFSFNLSAFTEILKSSKDDILFFFLMFVVVLFGYVVMAYSVFGQNSINFSTLLDSTISLFRMINNNYNYDDMARMNPSFIAFFYVSFMLLFTLLMKNMFIAIVVAHYEEFH